MMPEDNTRPRGMFVIVTAHDEAERLSETLAALARAFPDAAVWVADDGSTDATPRIAQVAGARLVRSDRVIGKGGAATLAGRAVLGAVEAVRGEAQRVLKANEAGDNALALGATDEEDDAMAWESAGPADDAVVLLCDGDLGESAGRLRPLVEAVRSDEADLAVAVFARKVGGGVGLAVGFARWAIRRRSGLETVAPISGQRALRASVLRDVLPFARGFGMEIGMTIDAVRAGHRVAEIELDLSHRATGRTIAGFAHRGRQLVDFLRVYEQRH
jgi:glycosyltransferase involved in cell wall biosynthesis